MFSTNDPDVRELLENASLVGVVGTLREQVADKTAAKAALFKELQGLRHQGAWGDDCVREW